MKTSILGLAAILIFGYSALSQEQQTEPEEMTRLRAQFEARVAKELEPWKARYASELDKLEKSLAAQGKLEAALVVRGEKENAASRLTADTRAASGKGNPKSSQELSRAMEGTVWLVYAPGDVKREIMLDVYVFGRGGVFTNLLHAKQKNSWKSVATNKVEVEHSLGKFDIKVDIGSSTGEVGYSFQAQGNLLVLAGTLPPN
jgi:hypothetical protein